MSDFDYDQWWSLHLRLAKGEPLSEAEQVEYHLGQTRLDDPEDIPGEDISSCLRTLRAAISRAAARHAVLTARSTDLATQIAALETAYQGLTGQRLTLEPHAQT